MQDIDMQAVGSFIALAVIVSGAVIALCYQVWRIERTAEMTAPSSLRSLPPRGAQPAWERPSAG